MERVPAQGATRYGIRTGLKITAAFDEDGLDLLPRRVATSRRRCAPSSLSWVARRRLLHRQQRRVLGVETGDVDQIVDKLARRLADPPSVDITSDPKLLRIEQRLQTQARTGARAGAWLDLGLA